MLLTLSNDKYTQRLFRNEFIQDNSGLQGRTGQRRLEREQKGRGEAKGRGRVDVVGL